RLAALPIFGLRGLRHSGLRHVLLSSRRCGLSCLLRCRLASPACHPEKLRHSQRCRPRHTGLGTPSGFAELTELCEYLATARAEQLGQRVHPHTFGQLLQPPGCRAVRGTARRPVSSCSRGRIRVRHTTPPTPGRTCGTGSSRTGVCCFVPPPLSPGSGNPVLAPPGPGANREPQAAGPFNAARVGTVGFPHIVEPLPPLPGSTATTGPHPHVIQPWHLRPPLGERRPYATAVPSIPYNSRQRRDGSRSGIDMADVIGSRRRPTRLGQRHTQEVLQRRQRLTGDTACRVAHGPRRHHTSARPVDITHHWFGNQSLSSRSADSGESEPCTRLNRVSSA